MNKSDLAEEIRNIEYEKKMDEFKILFNAVEERTRKLNKRKLNKTQKELARYFRIDEKYLIPIKIFNITEDGEKIENLEWLCDRILRKTHKKFFNKEVGARLNKKYYLFFDDDNINIREDDDYLYLEEKENLGIENWREN